jgi:hypothetical protein
MKRDKASIKGGPFIAQKCLLAVFWAVSQYFALTEPAPVSAEETLFISVALNGQPLIDFIEATEKEGEVFVRVREIANLVESQALETTEEFKTIKELNQIFPAKFTFSLRSLELSIEGSGKLPIEKRWERDHLHKYIRDGSMQDLPEVPIEYGLLGLPYFDVSSTYTNQGKNRFVYSILGSAEGLYGTTRLNLIGLDDELDALRVSWERVEPLWTVKLGDVFSTPVDLVARGNTGRGFLFSTFPVDRGSNFATETIEGDLQSGWEVELYRKGSLLDFQADNGTGRFTFEDVPLVIGDNQITLKFYGPEGQVRETTRRVRVGSQMAPSGKLWSNLSFVEQGESLFLKENNIGENESQGLRVAGEGYLGINKQLTLAGSLASLKIPNEKRKHYMKVGLRGAYFTASETLDLIVDNEGGKGVRFGVQRDLLDTGVQYTHVNFFDLETERERNLNRRDALRMNRQAGRVALEVIADREIDTSGILRYELSGRASASLRGVQTTNQLRANINGSDNLRGSFLVSGRLLDKLSLRSTVDYGVRPKVEVEKISANLDYQFNRDTRYRLAASKTMNGGEDYSISAGAFLNLEKAAVGLTSSYSTQEKFQVIASVTFSLSPKSSGKYQVSRKSLSNLGQVDVRIFVDKNNDGRFNQDDEPLEGVQLVRGGGQETNKNGIASLKRPPHRIVNVAINETSLEDPFLVAGPPVLVRPRPSHRLFVEIPVWETGEIEAQVEPGSLVEVFRNDKLLSSRYADFDGFIVFEKVPYGAYSVRSVDRTAKVSIDREHAVGSVQWEKGF